MRLGAFTTTYDELDWLDVIAPQLAAFDHGVVVLSTTPMAWYMVAAPDVAERPPRPDVARVRALCDRYGLDLIVGEFSQSTDAWFRGQRSGPDALGRQRLAGIRALLDCDAAAWFAPDELYDAESVGALKAAMISDPAAIWEPERTYTLWWNERWQFPGYWEPWPGLPIRFDPHLMDAGMSPREQGYAVKRAPGAVCWHFAFARPAEEMRRKFHSWGHAHEVHSGEHWRAWDTWEPGRAMSWPGAVVPIEVAEALPDDLRRRLAAILPRLRRA